MMKTHMKFTFLIVAFGLSLGNILAAEKIVGGPKGGRLLDTKPHRAEFFVNAQRQVEIQFYDAALKPVSPGTQAVAVTAEPKAGRTRLEMEKTPSGYVSKSALPAGDEAYRIVVQVRPDPATAPQNFRIDLNLETCGECKRAEYACTCGH
jgi:hypothetical protein